MPEAAETAQTFVANVNWAQPTWDLFIILFFVIAGFLYGLSLGRDRIVVILVSIYMSLAVVNTAPFIGQGSAQVGIESFFVLKVSAFLILFILLFFLISRSALLATIASSDSRGAWWQVLLFSFLHVGLLTAITLSFLPPSSVESLAPMTQTLFSGDTALFLWIVAPIIGMMIMKGGAREKNRRREYDYE
ncbi:MAG: hypothetical protein HYZ09_04150 [Candidatus Kerfeldbacteria bacterium]|nr:hypothetical protein [Candidatus Kerfeldbacteria bacterium]